MNILTDPMPQTVTLCGIEVPVVWDHRSCIKAHISLTDSDESDEEALGHALEAFYPSGIPSDADPKKVIETMVEFLAGAPVPDLPGKHWRSTQNNDRAYSFLFDQERILSAFLQQYRIDLTKETLHWWVFLALLSNLYENQMANIMAARTEEPGKNSSKDMKKEISDRKKKFALPVRKSAEEEGRRQALMDALRKGDQDEIQRLLDS